MTPRALLLWAGIVASISVELGAVALMLRPNVDPAYRAYYISKTSDCWPHQTAAAYTLGTKLSFGYPPKGVDFTPNKICGWFYPDEEGTWSYGSYSLLQLNFPPVPTPLQLTLEAGGMVDAAHPSQRVIVSANGTQMGTLVFDSTTPATRRLAVPADVAATGKISLRLDYPDALPGTEMSANEDPHLRALHAVALTLAPLP